MALYQLNRSEEGSHERSKEDSTIYLGEGDVSGLSLKNLVYLSLEQIVFHLLVLVRKSQLIFTILGKIAVVVPMPQHVDCIFSCQEDLKSCRILKLPEGSTSRLSWI